MSMDDLASVNLDKGQIFQFCIKFFAKQKYYMYRVLHRVDVSEENQGDIIISSMDRFRWGNSEHRKPSSDFPKSENRKPE